MDTDLQILGQVRVLHGAVHGALQPLVTGIHLLLRKPVQCLFDVQVVQIVIQVIVTQTWPPKPQREHSTAIRQHQTGAIH